MTREKVKDFIEGSTYSDYGKHEPLVNMSCVFEDDNGDTEVIFTVPIDWLCRYMTGLYGSPWEWPDVKKWLDTEYTSDDSRAVLDQAVLEDKVVFYSID